MPTLPTHYYDTSLVWQGKRRGTASAPGLPDLVCSAPPEFNGDPGLWSPEHLFVIAAETCLMATFAAIAEKSQLGLRGYSSSAHGTLEWDEMQGYVFTEIEIRAVIDIESEADREKALRVLQKAERGCLVARSMDTEVTVTAEIRVVSAAHA